MIINLIESINVIRQNKGTSKLKQLSLNTIKQACNNKSGSELKDQKFQKLFEEVQNELIKLDIPFKSISLHYWKGFRNPDPEKYLELSIDPEINTISVEIVQNPKTGSLLCVMAFLKLY